MASFEISFFSQSLNRSVRCKALLPTDQGAYLELPAKPPLKTLYLLHGMTGSQDTWAETAVLQEIVRSYQIAIIMPNGENSFYCDSSLTGNMYGTFVSEELVSFTRNCFPLSKKREDTFIGGLSMGGFGAIVNGLRNPETRKPLVILPLSQWHWGSVDAPGWKEFNGNPEELCGRVINPERVITLNPGEAYRLTRLEDNRV